jgi:hypothetical protein
MDDDKLFFYYLLEEIKRGSQKLSMSLFDQIWLFVHSLEGLKAKEKFFKTELPGYCMRQQGLAQNPFKNFFKDKKNVN